MIAVLVLFGIYTNALWSSRRNFCTQMNGLIQELRAKAAEQEAERLRAFQTKQVLPQSAGTISAADLSRLMGATKALTGGGEHQYPQDGSMLW